MEEDWEKWSKHVLISLEKLDENMSKLAEEVSGIKTEIALLKMKSGVWGLVGAAVPVVIGFGIAILKGVF